MLLDLFRNCIYISLEAQLVVKYGTQMLMIFHQVNFIPLNICQFWVGCQLPKVNDHVLCFSHIQLKKRLLTP